MHQTTNLAYHYTSIDTFLKLLDGIKNNQFMFFGSYISYMNDPTEFKYGFNMVHKLLIPIENELCVQNNDRLSIIWNSDEIREMQIKSLSESFLLPFVVCFSNQKDFLPQWITYGDNGQGVSLGFKVQDFCRIIKVGKTKHIDLSSFDNSRTYALRVSYKTISNRHLFLCSIKSMYKEYLNDIQSISQKEEKYKIQLKYLHMIAFCLSALIKHKAYSYENETRILYPRSKKDDVKFRTNAKGQIVPYIKIGIDINRLKRIVIGPCCDFESTKLMIETRLMQIGINDVKITKSQIPFR